MEKQNNQSKNTCYTYFRISGEFSPDEVTKILELSPEESWRIGDLGRKGSAHDFANWSFGRCDEYDLFVANQMRKTIAPLLDKIDRLNQIRTNNDVSFFLEVVPTIYAGNTAPCFAPSLDIIDFCHATRTEIDIDMYVFDSEKE